jgi:hypothetical protein
MNFLIVSKENITVNVNDINSMLYFLRFYSVAKETSTVKWKKQENKQDNLYLLELYKNFIIAHISNIMRR